MKEQKGAVDNPCTLQTLPSAAPHTAEPCRRGSRCPACRAGQAEPPWAGRLLPSACNHESIAWNEGVSGIFGKLREFGQCGATEKKVKLR